MSVLRGIVLAAALCAGASPAISQAANLIDRATGVEGNCQNITDETPSLLADGDATTAWSAQSRRMCELVLRFEDAVAASQITLSTINPDEGPKNAANLITIWGSHQPFGDVFFRLGQANTATSETGEVAINFGQHVNLHSLKIIMERTAGGTWPKLSGLREVRLTDVTLTGPADTQTVTRWPQPPMAPLKGPSDPILSGQATQCDRLAGMLYNPDSYGFSRSNTDLDVPEALEACQVALSRSPQSLRLAANLARVELMAERAPRAVARLTSPMLADYAPAQYLLGRSFENGWGVEKDLGKAHALYAASAAQDFAPALHKRAEKIDKDRAQRIAEGLETDDDKTVEANLDRAVALNHHPSMGLYFNHSLKHGLITPETGYDLIEQAAQSGDQGAMGTYSTNLNNGHKIDRRVPDSQHYKLMLSHLNLYFSMTNLSRDDGASHRAYWRTRGAYSGGYYALEHYAYSLNGGEHREGLATMTFERAMKEAEGGDGWAMEWVAQYYKKGFGVPKDPVQERAWRCKARAANNPVALSTYLPNIPGQIYNGNC